jgi:5-methylcytosine-specific restriction enzyme subunit McrC
MKDRRAIQVFEHETLHVGTRGFCKEHFDRLVLFNDKYGGQYLSPGYGKVKFNGYVGVFQVAGLTIEVLPKAGREGNKKVWHDALLGMLKVSGFLNLRTVSEADLKMNKGTLFDVYIEVFLAHCHALLTEGLIRQYRLKSDNRTALKGRLLFHEQLKHNTIRLFLKGGGKGDS